MSENLFRKKHRALTDEEKQLLSDLKEKADELNKLIPSGQGQGEQSFDIARTKLQEAIMWTVHGITT